ncbi:MAG: hypothetical protein QM778_06240 [Myxococcales bacterium]
MKMRALWLDKAGLNLGLAAWAWLAVACGDGGAGGPLHDVDNGMGQGPSAGPVAHGDPLGEALQQMVGPEGGELHSGDGRLSLVIPAGALSEPQLIGVQEVAATSPQHTGKSFRLSPAGIHFVKPVSIGFQYDDADVLGSSAELLRVAYQDEAGIWRAYRKVELDAAAHSVRVTSDHFSDWSLIKGATLLPVSGEVKIGEAIELRVMSCLEPSEESEDGVSVSFGYDCESEESLSAIAYGWTVNGVLGGDESVGTIRESQQRGRAIYTPPRSAPASNPVAISVTVRDTVTELFGTQILVSNVRVQDDSAKWTGTIAYEVGGSHTVQGQSGYVGSETHTYSHKTVFTVTGVTKRDGNRTELTFQQISDVSYEKDGSMRKEVHEICQAGGPVILRHLFEYSIASWDIGHYEGSVAGDVYVGDDGEYSIGVDAAYIPLAGQEVKVDKYTHFCSGEVLDDSGTRELESSESVSETYYEGTLDPEHPDTLSGTLEKVLYDEYMSKLRVSWNLQRNAQ